MGVVLSIVGFGLSGVLLSYVPWPSRWLYLIVAILFCSIGWLSLRVAYHELQASRLTDLVYLREVAFWDFIPWLLFAFIPLQLAYYLAIRARRSRLSQGQP